jgi:hypothetical protein
LATDASSSHVGAVLQQAESKAWKLLAFFSKKLSPTQQRYSNSTFDRELSAICLAIKHFRFLLEGRQFYVITDHKPLTSALHSKVGQFLTFSHFEQKACRDPLSSL